MLAHHVVGLVLVITESWSRVFGSGKESVIKPRRSGSLVVVRSLS